MPTILQHAEAENAWQDRWKYSQNIFLPRAGSGPVIDARDKDLGLKYIFSPERSLPANSAVPHWFSISASNVSPLALGT